MPPNKIVLVVEDELPLQNAIKFKLGKHGFDVVTARNVEQALNHLADIPKIDLIWVDHYLLGKETGLDFVAKVKNDKKWKSIPVFIVSNTASEDKVKSYLALGVDKYYTKSDFRLDAIISEINSIL
jgi:DNA-binding response OmpR family regulator